MSQFLLFILIHLTFVIGGGDLDLEYIWIVGQGHEPKDLPYYRQ